MNRCLSITALLAFLTCLVAPPAAADEDNPLFGKMTTSKKTAIKVRPNAHAALATLVDANAELRWVEGERKGKYVRVMLPKGPLGWVLESDVKKVADLQPSIGLEAPAQPCVTPETLSACTTQKPTGCSTAGSPHGLVNQLKRTF